MLAFFISLFALNGCQPKQPPVKELLPMPGVHAPVTDKIIKATLDKSPMDMIYYPVDYPVLKMSGKVAGPPVARLIYSRPAKDGRIIFGNLVQYNKPWRLGANEATEIEFFTDVNIQDKKIRKGRYILYCVPFPDRWELILNEDLFVWGLKIHTSKDICSFNVPVTVSDTIYEVFTMDFVPQEKGMEMTMAWDNVKAGLPIRFSMGGLRVRSGRRDSF